MHFINIILLQVNPPAKLVDFSFLPIWAKFLIIIAPLLTTVAAISNFLIARAVFKFTRAKHDKDRNVKWFQELIYSAHKETINSYFSDLHGLKNKFLIGRDLNENEKIELINTIKELGERMQIEFVNNLEFVDNILYKVIKLDIDALTDSLTEVIDTDEKKLYKEQVYQREIANRIAQLKGKVIQSLFNYKG